MEFKLPLGVISKTDITRILREINSLNDFFVSANVRGTSAQPQIPQIQQESLAHGAQGVMYKPLVVKQLIKVIQSMMRNIPGE